MKAIVLYLFFCFNSLIAFSQFSNELCLKNEKVVFAFQLKNKKWVSVCKEINESYIVYRFGTKTKIELTYPSVLDTTSWQKFSFNGYNRGGGKQNAAMYWGYLSFTNNNVNYEIYHHWNSEDDKELCGMRIALNGKKTELSGILNTRKGHLLSLLQNDKIKQEEN